MKFTKVVSSIIRPLRFIRADKIIEIIITIRIFFINLQKNLYLKKIIPILLTIVLLYNTIGYLVVFKGLQYSVKKEIKRRIKRSVPENELFLIKVTENDINTHKNGFKFIEKGKEFTLDGKMYDIVYKDIVNDTIYYKCINDVQEEKLFASLGIQVKQTMETSKPIRQKSSHLTQNIVKDAVFSIKIDFKLYIVEEILFREFSESNYLTFHVVPTPPPNCI